MQMLFWNPFTSEQEVEEMDWYRILSSYALYSGTQIYGPIKDDICLVVSYTRACHTSNL